MTVKINADTSDGLKFVSDTSGEIDLQANGSTKVHMDSDGKVGIGTSSPAINLETSGSMAVSDTSTATKRLQLDSGASAHTINSANYGSDMMDLNIQAENLIFKSGLVGVLERMRLTGDGDFLIGTTDNEPWNNGSGNSGFAVKANGRVAMAAPDTTPLFVNRVTSDGRLVDFLQDGSTEGEITVSGSTVSYNGGHLARWGRLPSGEVDNTILKGTVMSNLDKMIVWSYNDLLYTKDDKLPEGKSVGDVKKAAYTAENEQRNEIKVSDVEGDINVAGLFVAWRNESDDYNDIGLAMTGDMVIRIAQGTTVQRGDLLMSAGNGTAKPQGDDIVRSKTIAKVTSITVIKTYDDNSYLVPCVIMAC